jgi:hypothetical protein
MNSTLSNNDTTTTDNTKTQTLVSPDMVNTSLGQHTENIILSSDINKPDANILGGDNKVDVEIEPDVKNNSTKIQLCSCVFVWNCFTNSTVARAV